MQYSNNYVILKLVFEDTSIYFILFYVDHYKASFKSTSLSSFKSDLVPTKT